VYEPFPWTPYPTRFSVGWEYGDDWLDVTECQDAVGYQLEPYLKCPPRGADPTTATATAAEARACADLDRLLAMQPEAREALLSKTFCASTGGGGGGSPGVGPAFAGAVMKTLDANSDGSVSCTEWGIAKMIPTLDQLGGVYRGLPTLPKPECPMSTKGAEEFARYNAYLSGLARARADNVTGADALKGR
jgi:hypothetical protein